MYYVTMTDEFLSGWGHAENKKNVLSVACESQLQADQIKLAASLRGEMTSIKITKKQPKNTEYVLVSNKKFSDLGRIWHGDMSTYKKRNKKRLANYENLTLSNFLSKRAYHKAKGHVNIKLTLQESDCQQLADIIASGCSTKIRSMIYHVLKNNFYQIKSFGLLDRLYLNKYSLKWSYCPGQDSVTEMRWIRKELLKYV